VGRQTVSGVSCRGKCPAAATGVTAPHRIRGSRATTEKSGNLLRSRVKGRSFPLTGPGSLSHIEPARRKRARVGSPPRRALREQ
jgi:hypothetical protein